MGSELRLGMGLALGFGLGFGFDFFRVLVSVIPNYFLRGTLQLRVNNAVRDR